MTVSGRAASWAAVIAAPLSIALLIVRYGVNVAVQDEIDVGAFLVRNHSRFIPSFADLFVQHNESRILFPRLIYFYFARLGGLNVKYEMAVMWLLACGILAAILLLARRCGTDAPGAVALTALLVFSPVQWWNWLFGIQIVIFIPLLMLVTAMLVATSARPFAWRLSIAALCCLIATFSYANGMLLWVLAGIALFARERRPALIGIWTVIAATTIGAYFAGYVKPQAATSALSALAHPMGLIAFVLAFIGQPLTFTRAFASNALLGAIVVALFIAGAARARQLPWTILGAYSLISGFAAAAGRLGYGESAALEPRYTTFAIPLWIATVMLWSAAPMPRPLKTAAATALIALHVLASSIVWPDIRASHRDRLVARAATHYALVLPDQSLVGRLIYPRTPHALRTIAGLSSIGYVNPPIATNDIVNGGPTRGAFEGAMHIGSHEWILYGWAVMPDGRPADAVAIARDGHVVALSERTVARPDRPGLGWDLPVTPALTVPGTTLTAWAYDTNSGQAYRLAGSLVVRR